MRRRGRAAEGNQFHAGRKSSIDFIRRSGDERGDRSPNDRRGGEKSTGLFASSYHHHLFFNSPSRHDDRDDGDFLPRSRDAEENEMEGSAHGQVEMNTILLGSRLPLPSEKLTLTFSEKV